MKAGAKNSASVVTNVSTSDDANNGDASDLHVSFTKVADESNILGYRVFVVPTANVASEA